MRTWLIRQLGGVPQSPQTAPALEAWHSKIRMPEVLLPAEGKLPMSYRVFWFLVVITGLTEIRMDADALIRRRPELVMAVGIALLLCVALGNGGAVSRFVSRVAVACVSYVTLAVSFVFVAMTGIMKAAAFCSWVIAQTVGELPWSASAANMSDAVVRAVAVGILVVLALIAMNTPELISKLLWGVLLGLYALGLVWWIPLVCRDIVYEAPFWTTIGELLLAGIICSYRGAHQLRRWAK